MANQFLKNSATGQTLRTIAVGAFCLFLSCCMAQSNKNARQNAGRSTNQTFYEKGHHNRKKVSPIENLTYINDDDKLLKDSYLYHKNYLVNEIRKEKEHKDYILQTFTFNTGIDFIGADSGDMDAQKEMANYLEVNKKRKGKRQIPIYNITTIYNLKKINKLNTIANQDVQRYGYLLAPSEDDIRERPTTLSSKEVLYHAGNLGSKRLNFAVNTGIVSVDSPEDYPRYSNYSNYKNSQDSENYLNERYVSWVGGGNVQSAIDDVLSKITKNYKQTSKKIEEDSIKSLKNDFFASDAGNQIDNSVIIARYKAQFAKQK